MEERHMASGIRQGASLECRDLVIPLHVSVLHWLHTNYVAAAAASIQPLILASLQEAARAGWKADQPTDFMTLFSRSQVRTTMNLLYWHVTSVTIRLTRALPIQSRYPRFTGASAHCSPKS